MARQSAFNIKPNSICEALRLRSSRSFPHDSSTEFWRDLHRIRRLSVCSSQPVVVRDVAAQLGQGETGIMGMMMESFLVDGRQNLIDRTKLVYGQSITDACLGWDATVPVLHELAEGVRARRRASR